MASSTLTWITVGTLASGEPLRVPLHTIIGERPGPVVGISTGIHGDEIPPIEAVRQFVAGLDPAELCGTLRIMPVANPLAVQALTRHTPQDMQNLNRVFPGDPDGWLTEQLAHAIVTAFLPGLDALLDLHAGGLFPTVDYVYILNAESLSRAFGFPVMYRPAREFVGTLSSVAVERGIASVVVEMGGGLAADERYITRAMDGITSALREIGSLPGVPAPAPDPTIVTNLATLRAHHGGLLVPEVRIADLGSVVPRGHMLGRIFSPYTFGECEVFTAPFARTVLILLRGAVTHVQIGDYAYMLGEA